MEHGGWKDLRATTDATIDATIDVTIQTLAAGGDGVGTDAGGRITFVPGTVPGERVRARVIAAKKSYAHAELVAVLEPSSSRVEPECPLFAARQCGGCQWQHMEIAEQRRGKESIVRRELRKYVSKNMVLLPIAGDVPPFKWRRRARMHWFRPRNADRATVGFFAPRSHRVVDVEACVQMARPLADALGLIRRELAPHLRGQGQIELLAGHTGEVHMAVDGWCSPRHVAALVGKGGLLGTIVGAVLYGPTERQKDRPKIFPRAAPSSRRGRSKIQWGKRSIALEPKLQGRADLFAQASEAGNQALAEAVLQATGDLEQKRVVEFYAGSGNLTRALARAEPLELISCDVRGAPWYREMGMTRRPSRSGAARDHYDVRIGAAEDVATDLVDDGYYFDIAVLDPPRTGAAELLSPLIELHPARIVYISCDPATLARDMDALTGSGYRAIVARPLDLMPQTAHVEVVVRLDAVESGPGYGE